MKKFLVLNFGGIGDEILFLPTLISLKKAYPNSKITLALEKRSRSINDLTNIIDEMIFVDVKGQNKYFELLKFLLKIKFMKFDTVISTGSSPLVSILLFLTGIKNRYGYNTGKLSEILLTEAIYLNKKQYATNMYHDLISPLTDIKTKLPEINIQKQEKIPNSVLIHPGVSKLSVQKNMIKTIPANIWAEVIDKLAYIGKKVMLVGGPDDKEIIDEILSLIQTPDLENLYGTTKNLRELAELISKTEKFLCSDSAPLHIAVALKTRTYAIFGSTDDKKLIPNENFVTALKVEDNCPLKPCLWDFRQTTCEELSCLKFSAEDIFRRLIED